MVFFTFYVIELSNMFQGETVHDRKNDPHRQNFKVDIYSTVK